MAADGDRDQQEPDQLGGQSPNAQPLRVHLLHSFNVSCDGRTLIDESWSRGKAKALLKLLALAAPAGLHREQVIEALWPQHGAVDTAGSLRQAIFQIRSALKGDGHDRELVQASGHILRLAPDVAIDLHDFTAKARRALSAAEDEALYDEAHAAWPGELLPADLYEEWTRARRDQVRDLHYALLRSSADLCMRRGRTEKSIAYLKGMLAVDALDEEVHRQLMLAYSWSGKRHLAIRQYESCGEILLAELDSEPSPETENLYHRIQANTVQVASTAAPSEEKFVGRLEELRLLRKALREAVAGKGRTSLLVADPGMGKTRTSKEIAREALLAGCEVLWGRCYEGDGATAFRPWIDVIRSYMERVNPDELAADLGDGAGYIAQVVPEIRSMIPDVPNGLMIDNDQTRYQLFDSIAAFLRNAARRQPLAIILDDLHGADVPSLLLLQFIVRELGDAGVFLLATTRAVGRAPSNPLSPAIAEMAREDGFQEIELTGLSAAETGQLVEAVAGAPVSEDLVASVYGRTEGNPFFTIEIARILIRTLDVTEEQAARQARELIPPTVRAAIAARLRGVSSECYQLLSLASVIGRRFKIGVLAAAAGITVALALAGIQQALDTQLIGGLPDDPTAFIFLHALILGTLYEAIPASRRPGLHEKVGQAIEVASADAEGSVTELAYHFVQAARGGGDPTPAIKYCVRAAAQATKLTAYEDSIRHLNLALDLCPLDSPFQRAEVTVELGLALRRTGDQAEADKCFRTAIAASKALHSNELLARTVLAMGSEFWLGSRDGRAWDAELVALMEEAALGWPQDLDNPQRARLLSRLALARFLNGESERATEAAFAAEGVARRLDDDALLAEALKARYIALFADPLSGKERLSIAVEMVRVAQAAGTLETEFQARCWKNVCHLEFGDIAEVNQETQEIQILAKRIRLPVMRCMALNIAAGQAILAGQFDDGDRLGRAAVEAGRRAIGYPAELIFPAAHQFQMFTFAGGLQGLLPVIQGVLRVAPMVQGLRCNEMLALLEAGDTAACREQYDYFATAHFSNVKHDELWLHCFSLLADVAVELGDIDGMREIQNLIAPCAGLCAVLTEGVSWWGSVSHPLGRLSAALGQYDRATRYFEDALVVHQRMEAQPFIARTQIEYGKMLRERLAPGDEGAAGELIDNARATAIKYGLDALLRKIER